MKLSSETGRPIVALEPDDTLTDSTSTIVGRVDWKKREVIIGEIRSPLEFATERDGIAVVTPMATFHAAVDASSQLDVDGKRVGKLSGFSSSKEGWRRLAALVLAIPMLSPPPTPAPDAATEDIAPPAPPPPPPSHGSE